MKQTEYFLSANQSTDQAKQALLQVINMRDDFLKKNSEDLGEVENEDVQIIATANHTLYVLLKLTYFRK